jgi:hypothetical protein
MTQPDTSPPTQPPEFVSFEEFWPHFLSSHRNPAVRWAHVAALASLLIGLRRARKQRRLFPLVAGGAVAGALAVFSHPLLEGEWPQNLGQPRCAARGFLRLCLRTVSGRIEDDLAALDSEQRPS